MHTVSLGTSSQQWLRRKRCWAGPSQFIRVWIQHRIRLVLLESRSDLCPAVISSASNGKIILQTFSPGFSHPIRAPECMVRVAPVAGAGHWKLSPRDLIQLLLSTPAQPSSWESLFVLWRGAYHVLGRHIRPEWRQIEESYRCPPSWEPKTQFRGTISATDTTTANRHLPITPTVACLCPRPRAWDSHSHQDSDTRAPNKKLEGPVPEWSGWTTRVPSARQRWIKLNMNFARVDK